MTVMFCIVSSTFRLLTSGYTGSCVSAIVGYSQSSGDNWSSPAQHKSRLERHECAYMTASLALWVGRRWLGLLGDLMSCDWSFSIVRRKCIPEMNSTCAGSLLLEPMGWGLLMMLNLFWPCCQFQCGPGDWGLLWEGIKYSLWSRTQSVAL